MRALSVATSIVRHRLFHFVVAGAVIAAVAPRERSERVIAIDEVRVSEALRAEQARVGRPLSSDEQTRVTDRVIDDEVLAREALRLGLATDDPIIRARLAQQMRAQLGERRTPAADASGPRRRLAVWYATSEREAESIAHSIRATGMEHARGLGARPPIPDGAIWDEKGLASVVGVVAAKAAFGVDVKLPTSAVASAWGFYVFVPLETIAALPAPLVRDDAEVDRFVRKARTEYTITLPAMEGVN